MPQTTATATKFDLTVIQSEKNINKSAYNL